MKDEEEEAGEVVATKEIEGVRFRRHRHWRTTAGGEPRCYLYWYAEQSRPSGRQRWVYVGTEEPNEKTAKRVREHVTTPALDKCEVDPKCARWKRCPSCRGSLDVRRGAGRRPVLVEGPRGGRKRGWIAVDVVECRACARRWTSA